MDDGEEVEDTLARTNVWCCCTWIIGGPRSLVYKKNDCHRNQPITSRKEKEANEMERAVDIHSQASVVGGLHEGGDGG